MRRTLLVVFGIAGAIALMLALASGALSLSRSNPSVHPVFIFAPFGVLYTLIILTVASRI